jgi:hypothetical protein
MHYHVLRSFVPDRCPRCGASAGVGAATVIQAGQVSLTWYCDGCKAEWPIAAGEYRWTDRRRTSDRRRMTRTDRRTT